MRSPTSSWSCRLVVMLAAIGCREPEARPRLADGAGSETSATHVEAAPTKTRPEVGCPLVVAASHLRCDGSEVPRRTLEEIQGACIASHDRPSRRGPPPPLDTLLLADVRALRCSTPPGQARAGLLYLEGEGYYEAEHYAESAWLFAATLTEPAPRSGGTSFAALLAVDSLNSLGRTCATEMMRVIRLAEPFVCPPGQPDEVSLGCETLRAVREEIQGIPAPRERPITD